MDDNFHSLQEKNAYIRKNPFYTMIIERSSFLTHRRQFPKIVVTGGNAKPWTEDNGIQFLNIYNFFPGDMFE